jgi:hypothetical protein
MNGLFTDSGPKLPPELSAELFELERRARDGEQLPPAIRWYVDAAGQRVKVLWLPPDERETTAARILRDGAEGPGAA